MRKLHLHRETLQQLTPDALQAVFAAAATPTYQCLTQNAQCPTSGNIYCPVETQHASITGTTHVTAACNG